MKWPIIEKECYAISFSLAKLDCYLHNAKFVIRCDHKPLKYLLDSPMKNKKVQLWALNISSYDCQIEFIEGSKNFSADLLSSLPETSASTLDTKGEEINPEINRNTYEISTINSNELQPSAYSGASHIKPDNRVSDTPTLPNFDMINEQADDTINHIKRQLKTGRAPKTVEKHYIVMDGLLYYISDIDNEPTLPCLYQNNCKKKSLSNIMIIMGILGERNCMMQSG